MKFKKNFYFIFIFSVYLLLAQEEPPHHWQSHSMVAKKVIKIYDSFNTLKANFIIHSKKRIMKGIAYYKKPGKVRFEFSQPYGDLLISDGKILWIVVAKQRLVGKQDLKLKVQNENKKPIFAVMPGRGIRHLFRKYHYRFDGIQQPKEIGNKNYYVMDLEQKVKIGGYEKMKLFINAKTYWIEKAIAEGSFGTITTIEFFNIQPNVELAGKLFQYTPPDNVKIVLNPLVSEDK